jgi:hypothetical protein
LLGLATFCRHPLGPLGFEFLPFGPEKDSLRAGKFVERFDRKRGMKRESACQSGIFPLA